MGTCSAKCRGCTDKLRRESLKRKKPPRPEEYKIEEGKNNNDGKVITESMRLNMSETHPERQTGKIEMNHNGLNRTQYEPHPKGGVMINRSGLLKSEMPAQN